MIAMPTSRTWATNSSSVSSVRNPGIDSSLSSVPPVWPSPRPLIFPSGTPQAATIGPTASDVLSPTPPVECLSTTLRPSARAEVDRLAARDHRVGQRVRLGLGQAAEVDGHAERGHLVVRHLAARVAEDQLGQLVGGELMPVALALDQLGRADHFVATKTVGAPDAKRQLVRGSSVGADTCDIERRYAQIASSSGIVTQPSACRASTVGEGPPEQLGAVLARERQPVHQPRSPASSRSSARWPAPFVTATSRPPGRSDARELGDREPSTSAAW